MRWVPWVLLGTILSIGCVSRIKPSGCGEDSCSSQGTCREESGSAVCECQPGYVGTRCEKCAEGFQARADGQCAGTEYRCDTATCGARAERRECTGGTCEEWTLVTRCSATQACAADASGANCSDCPLGCGDNACCECQDKSKPCCDGCRFYALADNHLCQTVEEFECHTGGCDASVWKRQGSRVCQGDTAECTGELTDSLWALSKDCNASQICVADGRASATCQCSTACCTGGALCSPEGACKAVVGLPEGTTQAGDLTGGSVTIQGSYAIVGVEGRDITSPSALSDVGGALLYQRYPNGTWSQPTLLQPDPPHALDTCGNVVTIYGDIAVVACPGDDTAGSESGAIFVFQRNNLNQWPQVQKLTDPQPHPSDRFGDALALNAEYLFVGMANSPGDSAGHVVIYSRNATSGQFTYHSKLIAPSPQAYDHFGCAVAVDGTTAVVGAYGTGGPTDPTESPGAAYVYKLSQGLWQYRATLVSSEENETKSTFGYSVSLKGDTLLIGAIHWYSSNPAGAAIVFAQNPQTGAFESRAILKAPNEVGRNNFGQSVSLGDGLALIGSPASDGSDGSSVVSRAGAAFLFQRSAQGTWNLLQRLTAPDGQTGDDFGTSVSLSGQLEIIGASGEDGGVGDPKSLAGKAYTQ